jgi:hypothetical protein
LKKRDEIFDFKPRKSLSLCDASFDKGWRLQGRMVTP